MFAIHSACLALPSAHLIPFRQGPGLLQHNLWHLLSPHWTTGSQQSDFLDALSDHIGGQPDLVDRFCVKGLALSLKIIEAAATRDTNLYKTAWTFEWIWKLGDNIALHKQGVLTLHNLGENNQHWVALVVDSEAKVILYRNLFGTDIPPKLLEAYQWWLLQHTSSSLAHGILPITFQEPHDTSSCGFLSHNSLEHFAFPGTVLLIATSGIRAARMKAFLSIAEQVLEQVSPWRYDWRTAY